jgi:hypothetical protein
MFEPRKLTAKRKPRKEKTWVKPAN